MKTKVKLLEVNNLKQYFAISRHALVKAVDDVSFYINEGETFGLVGESGCGKTTCGRSILKIYEPSGGDILYRGQSILARRSTALLQYRKEAQMIFQDPYASLDPRMTIDDIISEGIRVHFPNANSKDRQAKVVELLELVGLTAEHASRFPHELSGGQRQRIGIARALAVEPEFIVCDEPISALDVSIQAQIVNLLRKLQGERSLTFLFISHDLSMVKHISERIAVMYLGSIVELSSNKELYDNPLHPYAQALISAIPLPDPDLVQGKKRIHLEGEIPSPINTAPGCKFCTRCRHKLPICAEVRPELREVAPDHFVACHLVK